MIIMPTNNTNAVRLEMKYPGRLGMLFSPRGWLRPKIRYALDNDRYSSWAKGSEWDESAWRRMITKAADVEFNPLWCIVPDIVGDACATFDEWRRYYDEMPSGWRKALAVQDGMTVASVKALNPQPDVIAVGGTTKWKRRTLWEWCHAFPYVHVLRINTERWLWECYRAGAKSCDGTGWFRGDQVQLRGLHRFLERSTSGLGPMQLELEFAATFGPSHGVACCAGGLTSGECSHNVRAREQ